MNPVTDWPPLDSAFGHPSSIRCHIPGEADHKLRLMPMDCGPAEARESECGTLSAGLWSGAS